MTATPNPVRPGEQVRYVMTVVNRAATNLTGVTIRQVMPPHMYSLRAGVYGDGPFTWSSWSDYGNNSYIDSGEEVSWSVGTLPAGESRSVMFAAIIKSGTNAPPDNTQISSSVTAAASNGAGASASASVFVDASPELALSMEAETDSVGGSLTYVLRYGNASGANLDPVLLRALVPEGTAFVAAGDGGVLVGNEVVWNLGLLNVGRHGQTWFRVSLGPEPGNSGIVKGYAEIGGGAAKAQTSTVVKTAPALALSMTATPDTVRPGDQVQYAITVANRSQGTLTGVSIRHLMPPYMVPLRAGFYGDGPFPWSSWSDYGDNGYIDSGEEVLWTIGSLPPGESRTVLYAATMSTGLDAIVGFSLQGSSAEVKVDSGAGATASAFVFATGRAPRLVSQGYSPGGRPVISLEGKANTAYAIERSTDLSHWTSIATNVMPVSAKWLFEDLSVGSANMAFYRARLIQ